MMKHYCKKVSEFSYDCFKFSPFKLVEISKQCIEPEDFLFYFRWITNNNGLRDVLDSAIYDSNNEILYNESIDFLDSVKLQREIERIRQILTDKNLIREDNYIDSMKLSAMITEECEPSELMDSIAESVWDRHDIFHETYETIKPLDTIELKMIFSILEEEFAPIQAEQIKDFIIRVGFEDSYKYSDLELGLLEKAFENIKRNSVKDKINQVMDQTLF